MIDLINERPIPVSAARKQIIPHVNDGPISPTTVYRWINRGIVAGDGTRVRLDAVKVGRTLITTQEAVGRFLDELTRHSNCEVTPRLPGRAETHAKLMAKGLLKEGKQ